MNITDIRGDCDFQELYENTVRCASDGKILVEVGSRWGLSTAYMASYIKNSGKNITFYAVDYFDLRGISEGVWSQGDLDYVRSLGEIVEDNDMCYNAFVKALTNLQLIDYVTDIRLPSSGAVSQFQDNNIDFLFINSDTTYEGYKNELDLWLPKMKDGAIVSGDYYELPGVKRAVDDTFKIKFNLGTYWITENINSNKV